MSFVVIIPARFASTRLPGKPLQDINGKPMIVHVLERARESGADRIIVATDHPDVASAVEAAGGEVCMTRADHQSGTERLAEVVEKCGFSDDTVIVNAGHVTVNTEDGNPGDTIVCRIGSHAKVYVDAGDTVLGRCVVERARPLPRGAA